MIEMLKEAWKIFEKDYNEGRINSERCMQASLYHILRNLFDKYKKDYLIFVEPMIHAYPSFPGVPDLVICNNDKQVLCFLELKFTPHYYVGTKNLKHDLHKLIKYSNDEYLNDDSLTIDVFGPDSVYDLKKKKFLIEMPKYKISKDTLYIFAVLTSDDDKACIKPEETVPELAKIHFLLLTGIMTHDVGGKNVRSNFD